jgi:hypothetical protein
LLRRRDGLARGCERLKIVISTASERKDSLIMQKFILGAALILVCSTGMTVADQPNQPTVVKVPCKDMGDGRTLIDSLYLPDSFTVGKSHYTIVATRPTGMTGGWANKVCTLKIDR